MSCDNGTETATARGERKVNLGVTIDPGLLERVEAYRWGRRLSRSAFVRLALAEYLDRVEAKGAGAGA